MKIGIMQPYLFPYAGYFQLIGAVDRFVIYDDVNYIKQGWINRNRILTQQGPQRFTLKLLGASPNRLINEIDVGDNQRKLVTTVAQAYSRAPCFDSVFPLVEGCLTHPENNLARFLEFSLREVCRYMDIGTEILASSAIPKDNRLRGEEKVIAICKALGADVYINAIGGQSLYDKRHFEQNGIELKFIQMGEVTYPQGRGEFVPNLSIIDVLMHVPREGFPELLTQYTLI